MHIRPPCSRLACALHTVPSCSCLRFTPNSALTPRLHLHTPPSCSHLLVRAAPGPHPLRTVRRCCAPLLVLLALALMGLDFPPPNPLYTPTPWPPL
jgi:hypothetical protein